MAIIGNLDAVGKVPNAWIVQWGDGEHEEEFVEEFEKMVELRSSLKSSGHTVKLIAVMRPAVNKCSNAVK